MDNNAGFHHRRYVIALVIEVLLAVFGLAFAINDSSANSSVGAGLWGVWLIAIGIPATLVAWAVEYRLHKKHMASSQPVAMDPNWHSRNRTIILILLLVFFVIPTLYSVIAFVTNS